MRPISRIALLALAAALTIPATAQAGGWATVELDRAPSGIVAGKPWRVELIVKQHGVTPLADANPSIEIANDAGVVRTFHARRTTTVGTYAAKVTFPSTGTWRARIYDGWSDAVPHRLSAVTVGTASAPGGVGAAEQTAAAPEQTVAAPPAGAVAPERTVAAPPAGAVAPERTVAVPAAGGGFPWEQTVAIAVVALLWIAGWIVTTGRPRRRRARKPSAGLARTAGM